MSISRTPSGTSWLLSVSVLLSLAALATALLLRHTHQAPTLPLVLLVAFGSAPAAVTFSRIQAPVVGGGPAVVVGLIAMTYGTWKAWKTDALHLLSMDFPMTQVATNAAVVMAPLALAALGVVLLLAGVARFSGDRLIASLATAGGAALTLLYAVALLAFSVQSLSYIGGSVQWWIVLAAALTACAALLLPAAAVMPAPAVSAPALPRLGTRLPAVLLVVALLSGAGIWAYDRLASRTKLADLFPDPALAACVATTVGLSNAEQATSSRELDSVFALTCNGDLNGGGQIQSLIGLEHLPNLASLAVPTNRISDLSPLARTPGLTSVQITNNQVTDLAPLAALTTLREFGASGNQITDLAPLAHLADLYAVGLSGNRIADISPLGDLPNLTELDLGDNQITVIEPLSGSPVLDRLTLRRNQIEDLASFTELPALTMLNVSDNRIGDLAPLADLPKLDELWVGGNPVTDLTPLRDLPALLGVDLEGSDPNALRGMDELRDQGIYVGGLA
ncbi:leucine-rich repeat domain-containing protein [Kineosporia rhizophila]|uniref:leucine-rich repeat domain-containing protein n=1 Tax=Kineosporia rhizophila TaxID=84633 RepID=UPI001E3C40F5|nr:leucine-rich repeat domain-containing protein [Kineosporia rhizophila]MCE0535740.1 leucine-rich repeat domain-containing protein [Kineosporia rhizophila]